MLLLSADEALATTAVRRLVAHGHVIEWERRPASAAAWLKMRRFDVLLLDIVKDAGSGVRLLARLRRQGESTPALMLTADCADDRVLALDLGADDCLAWPAHPAELEARCRALLRRSRGRAADVFQHAGFRFDGRARRVHVGGATLPLPRREFALLEILVSRFGQVVRRHELVNGLFGPGEHIGANALELYVSRLRRRLTEAPIHIQTVRGVGYRLEPLGPAPPTPAPRGPASTEPASVDPAPLGVQHRTCQTVVMTGPTLLIADDHPLFRAAVIHVLRTALPEARMLEAASAGALGEVLGQHPDADLVLLDLAMPGARGFSALLHVRGEYPDVPVVVISSNDHPRVIRRAQQFGAAGFISKSAPADAIGSAVLAVLDGGSAFPPMQAERSEADAQLAANLAQLTPQQFRVLLCLADGLLNKQIAHQLGLAENTVKVHVTAILKKLDCYSRTQAAVLVKALEPESAP